MHPALWISKTGLSAQDARLATISNNLANASTVGFKKDRAVFEDLLYQVKREPGGQSSQDTQLPSGLQIGTGVRTVSTQKVFDTGNMEITDRGLDVAINGRGFFQVQLPDGNVGFTRNGQFHTDSTGQLVTANGYALIPSITIPEGSQGVTIGEDGTVVVRDGSGQQSQIGSMELVDFINPSGMLAKGQNLFLESTASGSPQAGTPGLNGVGRLLQNTLEGSNVNVVEELVNMIATQRTYEMNSKVVSTADQMLQQAAQIL
ncbi:MAG: flagellar basal-body rod protein FlgG [Gammaproteobacteria bacterium]|nr:flagellar basal-body rod protein FlgG [Gammaproteobacteria bacterium]